MTKSTTALLYFSLQARMEAKEKAWFGKAAYKNQELAKSLLQQSSKAVENSGFPVFHFHEGNQDGKSFGERLANAFQELYDKGYEAVVAVGNDSPEISKLDWNQIKLDLNSGKNLLGKSIRGGAYLLGISAKYFQKTAFKNLPWQSNKLYDALYFQLNTALNPIVELKTLRDLNTFFDLIKFQVSEGITSVFKFFLKQLFKIEEQLIFQISHFSFQIFKDSLLRAPPLY